MFICFFVVPWLFHMKFAFFHEIACSLNACSITMWSSSLCFWLHFLLMFFLMLIIACLWATAPDRETNFYVSLSPSSSNQIFTVTLWWFSDLVLDLLLSKGEWQEQGSSWNRRRTLCTSAYGHSSVSDCHLSAFLSHMTIVDNLIYKKFYVPAWPTML